MDTNNIVFLNKTKFCFLSAFLLFHISALANDDNNKVKQLDSIVVKALKEELSIEDTGATVSHFNQQDIDRQNATNLGDLFKYEPGVNVDESVTGNLNDIRIRGMGSDRVLILVDDAALPPSYTIGRDLSINRNYFDLDAMKEVDLIKGPMSTLYGGSALAGGVFMRTKDPQDFIQTGNRFGGELKTSYKTALRSYLLSGTVAGHLTDDLSAFVRMTYRDGHEMRNSRGKASSSSDYGAKRLRPDPANAKFRNILTKWVYDLNPDNKFSFTYEDFKDEYEIKHISRYSEVSAMPGFNPGQMIPYTNLGDKTFNKNRRQQFSFRHDFTGGNALFDKGFWLLNYQKNKVYQSNKSTRKLVVPPFFPPPPATRTDFRTRKAEYFYKSIGFNAEFNKFLEQSRNVTHDLTYGFNFRQTKADTLRWGDSINVATGLSTEQEPFPNKSEPETKVKEFGLFMQDRIGFFDDKFEVVMGLRFDKYSLKPKNDSLYINANPTSLKPSSLNAKKFSKRLALMYRPDDYNTLFVNYSEGFKAPNFNDVNTSYINHGAEVIRQANPDIKAETSKMYELGWNYNDDKKYLALTGFYTRYKNFIDFKEIETNAMGYSVQQTINLDKSYIKGLELKAGSDLFTLNNYGGTVGINFAAAYAKGKDVKTNQPIDSVEPLTATVGLNYTKADKLYLELRLKSVVAKPKRKISKDLQKTIDHMPGYSTVDLIAEYKPSKNVVLNAGVYNIFNKKYWVWGDRNSLRNDAYNRGTQPGINAAFSVKVTF